MRDPLDEYTIEQFDLTPEEEEKCLEIVKTTFLHHKQTEGGTILFDEQTFKIMFGSPYQSKEYFVRAIHKESGQLVGFMGGIPRMVSVQGNIYKFGIPAWLAVHYEHQKKGIARALGMKMVEIGYSNGFHGGFVEFDMDDHGIDAFKSIFRNYDFETNTLLTMRKFIVRAFDVNKLSTVIKLKKIEKVALAFLQKVSKTKNPRVRKLHADDYERVYELLQDHVQRNEMAVLRDKDDFLWYLSQPGVNCVVHENAEGIVDGYILAWKFLLAGFGNAIPFGWLDLVHTHRLSIKEATDLCKYLCETSREMGWYGLQTPYIPYFDSKPFKRAKYIFYPKILSISTYNLKQITIPKKVKSFYFDWR